MLGAYGLGRGISLVPLDSILVRGRTNHEDVLPTLMGLKPIVSYLNSLSLALLGGFMVAAGGYDMSSAWP